MNATTLPADPAALIESLDPDALRNRLAELDRQSSALRVLLRSAVARERARARAAAKKEVSRAD